MNLAPLYVPHVGNPNWILKSAFTLGLCGPVNKTDPEENVGYMILRLLILVALKLLLFFSVN